jgi:F-box protein 18 (helicase)
MELPSKEQARAIDSKANALLIEARSGSGKTWVLREIADRNPYDEILYLVYNKGNQTEAVGKFPKNVNCVTTHALAWSIGKQFHAAKKLGELRPSHIKKLYGLSVGHARLALTCVENFIYSADFEISAIHANGEGRDPRSVAIVVQWATVIWKDMCNLKKPAARMSHDGYVKLFQLSQPNLAGKYKTILLDEGQDTNPAMLAIVQSQACRRVVVGDRYQSINAYRGAVNALSSFEADEVVVLSESRRFGPSIAGLATLFLSHFRGEKEPVLSAHPNLETIYSVDTSKPYAVIARTNAKLFGRAAELMGKKKLHFVGGIASYPFDKLLDLSKLANGVLSEIKDPLFKTFNTVKSLEDYAATAQDKEIQMLLGIVREYGKKLPEIVRQIKESAVEREEDADVVLTTAHRSKGKEFKQVILLNDFADFVDTKSVPIAVNTQELEQELNLLYVAFTRTMHAIELNNQVKNVIKALMARNALAEALYRDVFTVRRVPAISHVAEAAVEQLLPKTVSKTVAAFDRPMPSLEVYHRPMPGLEAYDNKPVPGLQPVSAFDKIGITQDIEQRDVVRRLLPKISVPEASHDIELQIERTILRKGMFDIDGLAHMLGYPTIVMTSIVRDMVKKGRLHTSLLNDGLRSREIFR